MADEKEIIKTQDWLLQKTKIIYSFCIYWIWRIIKNVFSSWRDWLTPIVILFTGWIVALTISNSQNENSKQIASDQQRLLAIQIFNDRLIGNRIGRELSLTLADSLLNDSILVKRLRNISNKATLEVSSEGIWSLIIKERVDAIKDLAMLYYKDTVIYAPKVISILKKRLPNKAYINYWPPVISISNFFIELQRQDSAGEGLWYGTKDDYSAFATLKNSKYYYDPPKHRDSNMVPDFVDTALVHFREKK